MTTPPAQLAFASYLAYHKRGEHTTYMQSLREAFSSRSGAGWFMGYQVKEVMICEVPEDSQG
ncbi:hypothetical protein FACS1894184_08770 [Clostridia bacterium]|nr:hypothetical protein FACS1894184_08770 [Clostridia bacterium]